MSLLTDFRFALRSLARVKGLAITVVVTLALGIGANAAIFSVVRGVLLRPLVNRDEDRLIYIRQSAPGIGAENANFSVPEIQDLRARVKTLTAFGDFSTIAFTMVGLGEPRVVRAGVVGGSYFDVMGLRPVLGRLLGADRRRAAGGGRRGADLSLLDHRVAERPVGDRQDGETRRTLGDDRRRARAVGPLSVGNRDHRQRRHQPPPSGRDDGDRPRASDDRALRPARSRRRPRRARAPSCARSMPRSSRSIPRRIPRRPTSASTRVGCAIRSSHRREPSCWCCSPHRRWSSSSRARTSPT